MEVIDLGCLWSDLAAAVGRTQTPALWPNKVSSRSGGGDPMLCAHILCPGGKPHASILQGAEHGARASWSSCLRPCVVGRYAWQEKAWRCRLGQVLTESE